MIELFIFYVVFSYLYAIGAVISFYDGQADDADVTGMVFAFLFAPVTMPVLMGVKR
tara:strand:- start:1354 stop:1521 length:168 start_codon:yes stop_codon:yes gene_type:complete